MRSQWAPRLDRGLSEALERLRAVERADEDTAWGRTADVLAWLYRCEEAERAADGAYYEDRGRSPGGRALGGLIWYRAKVEHDGEGVRVLHLHPTEELFWDGQGWTPIEEAVWTGDVWQPIRHGVALWSWPLLEDVSDRHGRGLWYAEHVAGREVMVPVQAAVRYLRSR